MSKTVEATATFVLVNQSLACVHARDFMIIWHVSVGNIDIHWYTSKCQFWKRNMKKVWKLKLFQTNCIIHIITHTHVHACSRKMTSVPHMYTIYLFILKGFNFIYWIVYENIRGQNSWEKKLENNKQCKTICSFGEHNNVELFKWFWLHFKYASKRWIIHYLLVEKQASLKNCIWQG